MKSIIKTIGYLLWIGSAIFLFIFWLSAMTRWLGSLGTFLAFILSPGIVIFPAIYWIKEGVFPGPYFAVWTIGVVGWIITKILSDRQTTLKIKNSSASTTFAGNQNIKTQSAENSDVNKISNSLAENDLVYLTSVFVDATNTNHAIILNQQQRLGLARIVKNNTSRPDLLKIALQYYDIVLKAESHIGSKETVWNEAADVLARLGELDKAAEYRNQAKFARERNDKEGVEFVRRAQELKDRDKKKITKPQDDDGIPF